MDMSAGRRILAHAIRAQDTDPRALLGTADPAVVAERLRAYADALDAAAPAEEGAHRTAVDGTVEGNTR
jgi:hypothetical protein